MEGYAGVPKSDLRLALSVACIESLNIFMFPPLYHEITSQDSTFTLRVFSRDSSVIYDLLQNYEVDIGFGILPTKNPNIITEPLFGEEIFLVNAIEHAWAADVVHPSELDPSEEIYMFWGTTRSAGTICGGDRLPRRFSIRTLLRCCLTISRLLALGARSGFRRQSI